MKMVRDMRTNYLVRKKAKLTILLRRQGYSVCEGITGGFLKNLVEKTVVVLVELWGEIIIPCGAFVANVFGLTTPRTHVT